MIYDSDNSIVKDVEDYAVILHQVNVKGTMQQGIGTAISKLYPDWFREYHGYCQFFVKDGSMNFTNKDHTDEILGSWHKYNVPEKNIIICSAFGLIGSGKEFMQTDLDSWNKILRKIVNQTKYVNRKLGTKWTIHIPANIGMFGKSGDNSELMELFKYYFGDSEVDLYIHTH